MLILSFQKIKVEFLVLVFVVVLFGVQPQGPENLFHGVIKNYCMVVIVNGIVSNNLTFGILEIF